MRYTAIIKGKEALDKPYTIYEEGEAKSDCASVTEKVILNNVCEKETGVLVFAEMSFNMSMAWQRMKSGIYLNSIVSFDANMKDGKLTLPRNICIKQEYIIPSIKDGTFVPLLGDNMHGCHYCKHYDILKEKHKKSCVDNKCW